MSRRVKEEAAFGGSSSFKLFVGAFIFVTAHFLGNQRCQFGSLPPGSMHWSVGISPGASGTVWGFPSDWINPRKWHQGRTLRYAAENCDECNSEVSSFLLKRGVKLTPWCGPRYLKVLITCSPARIGPWCISQRGKPKGQLQSLGSPPKKDTPKGSHSLVLPFKSPKMVLCPLLGGMT